MKVKNPTGDRINAAGLYDRLIEPGETVEINDAYCRPRPGSNPDNPLPSILSTIAPQLVQETALPAIAPALPRTVPTQADFEAQGMPPGVAEVAAAQAAAEAKADPLAEPKSAKAPKAKDR